MALMYHPVLSSLPRARQADAWGDDEEGFELTLGALLSGKVRCFDPNGHRARPALSPSEGVCSPKVLP